MCPGEDEERFQKLEKVFREESIRITLKSFLDPFATSSAKSKSAFQTKTAAINVTPAPDGDYNIEQIKADTQWLSENSKIDEISALRIVVLDWQQSPFDSYASYFASGQQNEAGSNKSLASSIAYPYPDLDNEGWLPALKPSANFAVSNDLRHSRQSYLFENEKSYILRVAIVLMSVALSSNVFSSAADSINQPGIVARLPDWLLKTATEILNENIYGSIHNTGYQATIKLMEAFKSRLKRLIEGNNLPFHDKEHSQLASKWRMQKVTDLLDIIQLIIAHLELAEDIPTANLVDTWFKICCDYEFFSSNIVVS